MLVNICVKLRYELLVVYGQAKSISINMYRDSSVSCACRKRSIPPPNLIVGGEKESNSKCDFFALLRWTRDTTDTEAKCTTDYMTTRTCTSVLVHYVIFQSKFNRVTVTNIS